MSKNGELAARFRIDDGRGFKLRDWDPAETAGLRSKDEAARTQRQNVELLAGLQDRLYAQDRWAVLLIFQAMDAAGKDSAIEHVMSGVNPQGCQVYSFKAPSAEELDHDFLWRTSKSLPERGRIGIFNRSYYEEVLVVRVHQELLERQRLPAALVGKDLWRERFEDVAAFERYLARQGVLILKFFLNVSKQEQKRRFIKRLDEPEKNWKFAAADVAERAHWDEYMAAYEDAIRHTAAVHAPWYVVPADHKWFTRLTVSSAIVAALEGLDLHYPRIDAAKQKEMDAARAVLEGRTPKTSADKRPRRP